MERTQTTSLKIMVCPSMEVLFNNKKNELLIMHATRWINYWRSQVCPMIMLMWRSRKVKTVRMESRLTAARASGLMEGGCLHPAWTIRGTPTHPQWQEKCLWGHRVGGQLCPLRPHLWRGLKDPRLSLSLCFSACDVSGFLCHVHPSWPKPQSHGSAQSWAGANETFYL